MRQKPGVSSSESFELLRPREPVYRGVPQGPRYSDVLWDFTALVARKSQGERSINFASVPQGYQKTVRDVLVLLAQPDHRALRDGGVIRKLKQTPTIRLIDTFLHLRLCATWGQGSQLDNFQSWSQANADQFLAGLREGRHRPDGTALRPDTIRCYLDSLYLLRELGPALPEGGFSFQPWHGRAPFTVAQVTWSPENKTAPMAWETWAPLVAGSFAIVDRFSPDIIAAGRALRELPPAPRGPSGKKASRVIRDWEASGGRIPLSTGYGRTAHTPRGGRNTSLLFRMLGLNDSLIKRTNKSYCPETIALLDRMADDPDRRVFGGLIEPTVMVEHSDGSVRPWIGEIGPSEVLQLDSVLRAACYVVLCALTGMRDGEVQELTRDALTTRDGLPALQSVQHKSRQVGGELRGWWAPAPVIRVLEVLAELSPHPKLMFARSDSDAAGPYVPSRDIPRLIEFINGDPDTRFGRGDGLGLEPVHVDGNVAVNSMTLRRSFSVFASTRSEAELGLGIQLGHAAWRTTSGYTTDGQQKLAKLVDTDRKNLMRTQASAFILGTEAVAGMPAEKILNFRAQVVTDPHRAEKIVESMATSLHLGLTNDCMFNAATAACGPQGPVIADHVCSGSSCANSLFRIAHRRPLQAALERYDLYLDKPRLNPAFVERIGLEREKVVKILMSLDETMEVEK